MPGGEISIWENDGFAAPSTEYTSKGTEKIMRCYSQGFQDRAGNWHGSRRYNNCFWVFRCGIHDRPIANKTIDRELLNVDFLEANLNAALWNNTYQYFGVFQMRAGLKYRIGPIGQNTRGTQKVAFAEHEGANREITSGNPEYLTHMSSYDYTNPAKSLLQVVLDVSGHTKNVAEYLARVLTLVTEYPVKGRERYLGDRSTHPRN